MTYAADTKVPAERSAAELVAMIRAKGGAQIAQMDGDDRYVLAFALEDRQIRFILPIDPPTHPRFQRRRNGATGWVELTNAQRIAAAEQHRRSRLRALLLVMKAKFESMESGIETLEQAFLANVVMPNGWTVYEQAAPLIADAYLTGSMPDVPLLGGPKG